MKIDNRKEAFWYIQKVLGALVQYDGGKDATLVQPNTEKYLENPVFGSFRVHLVQFDFGK